MRAGGPTGGTPVPRGMGVSPMSEEDCQDVAALEQSDNVADSGHAFAVLKRGYTPQRKPHA